ncbi:MAG: cupin domain-containing protein [Candidatus Caldatribacteriaceae bacterium]
MREEEKVFRGGDWGIKYLFRGPRLDWGIIYLKPGTSMGAHYHEEVEETFFILEGRGILRVNGEEIPVSQGMAFRLEPGEKHDLYTQENSSLRGIFIKVPYLPEDKINC